MKHRDAWLVAGLVAASAVPASAAEITAVHLRGSTALVPAAQTIAEAFMATHPDVTIVVRGGDSEPGLKALLDGTVEIAMISSALPPEIQKRAKALAVTLEVHPVASDAIVPVVHPNNPVSSLSLDQLGAIYAGSLTDWGRVGGTAGAITLLAQPGASGTASGWHHAVVGDRVPTPRADVLSAGNLKAKVAGEASAIGYLGLTAVDATVKAVSVEGIMASDETVANGRYPIRRPLSIVTTATASPATRQVVASFQSAESRAALAASGLVPAQ